jgi:hypothetical protein
MKRYLSWFFGPLLIGAAVGGSLGARPADACRPQMIFWVLEKAETQPEDALADADLWPSAGLLDASSVSLNEGEAWFRIEFSP